jgi:peptidoglycan hydrolase-like protein with peptidoglycan-binding domain
MNIQELFAIHNPNNIKINSGGSCVGGIGGTNWDLSYNEIRVLPFGNTQPWYYIQESINRKIQMSVNVDQYITRTNHWLPSELEYKKHVDSICVELLNRDSKIIHYCDITVDNEPLKDNYHPSTDSYIKYVKWCSQVAKSYGFKVSAGNEEFNLAEHRVIVNGWKNLYYEMGLLKQQGIIDRISIHIQGACLTEELRKRWTQFCLDIVNTYKFKLEDTFICTEAAYTDPKTTMYSHWIPMFKMALDLRCSAIGFVFVDYDTSFNDYTTDYSWLAIFKNGQLRTTQAVWNDFREISLKYARSITFDKEEDMLLERFYYQNRPTHLIKDDTKGYGIMFLRRCFGLAHGSVFDTALTEKVKAYQSEYKLLVDGKVGPETFSHIGNNLDGFNRHYCYVHSLWARRLTY